MFSIRWFLVCSVCCLSFVIAGCTGEAPKEELKASGPDHSLDPSKPGPYAVGVRTWKVVDSSRVDEKTKKPRELKIEVWYPTSTPAKDTVKDVCDLVKDAPKDIADKVKKVAGKGLQWTQNAYRDATVLGADKPYPLILFSHSSGGFRFQSTYQMTHLASHGYVIVAVGHVGNTINDLIRNEGQPTSVLLEATEYRPKDVKFAYEETKRRVEDPKSPFYQKINLKNVGVTGHSFGGMTTLMMTKELAKLGVIKAVAPQTPHTSALSVQGLTASHIGTIPVMMLASQADGTLKYEEEMLAYYKTLLSGEYFKADRYLFNLLRGGHYNYSNFCQLSLVDVAKKLNIEPDRAHLMADGCDGPDTSDAHGWINKYATAFFNLYLRGDSQMKDVLKDEKQKEYTFEAKLKK